MILKTITILCLILAATYSLKTGFSDWNNTGNLTGNIKETITCLTLSIAIFIGIMIIPGIILGTLSGGRLGV